MKFAVAKHAADKQTRQKNRKTDLNCFYCIHVVNGITENAKSKGKKPQKQSTVVRTAIAEAKDKRDEINCKRGNPEQRNSRNIFINVVGYSEQQGRAT